MSGKDEEAVEINISKSINTNNFVHLSLKSSKDVNSTAILNSQGARILGQALIKAANILEGLDDG